jgi:putative transposase
MNGCVQSGCERFLGSLRRECLNCYFILSEHQLLQCVTEYVQYFNHARPHQGIAQAIPMPMTSVEPRRVKLPHLARLGC